MRGHVLAWLVLCVMVARRGSVTGRAVAAGDRLKQDPEMAEEEAEAEDPVSGDGAEPEDVPKTRHKSHKHIRHARTEAIKRDILDKLGMEHVPGTSNVSLSVEERRKVLKLYQKSMEETRGRTHSLFAKEEYYAKSFHSFSDTGEVPAHDEGKEWRARPSYVYVEVPIAQPADPNLEVEVNTGVLKVYKAHVSPAVTSHERVLSDGGLRVSVYQNMPVAPPTADEEASNNTLPRRQQQRRRKRLLDSRIINVNTVGWESFDIREAVQDWVADPGSNLGVELTCDYVNLTAVLDLVTFRSPEENGGVDGEFLPTVSVLAHERPILVRHKRSEEKVECATEDHRRRCCRYPLWISFAEIGWDEWVLAPDGYQAYYCDGSCPHKYKTAHTFAAIKSLINLYNPAAAPEPCCTATRLKPLSLVHLNSEGQLDVSVYEDMIVDECKCS